MSMSGLSGLSGLSGIFGVGVGTTGVLLSWYEASSTYCFQDSEKTVSCTDDTLVRVWEDKTSGNDLLSSAEETRPTFYTSEDRVNFDTAGEPCLVTCNYGTNIIGTLVEATSNGLVGYRVNINTTIFFQRYNSDYHHLILYEGFLNENELEQLAIDLNIADGWGSVTSFNYRWLLSDFMTTFPIIDTSSGTTFVGTWYGCGFSYFPELDISAGTDFNIAWTLCNNLITFPVLNFISATNISGAWQSCTALTTFPAIDFPIVTNASSAWNGCSSLISFGECDLSSATNLAQAWRNCSSLTTFPEIDLSACTSVASAWNGCSGLTTFPSINFPVCLILGAAWQNCSSLTSFPLINIDSATSFANAWNGCTSLVTFPASMFDNCQCVNYTGTWQNCALSETSVNNILESIAAAAATFGLTSGTIVMNNGTSAAPSGNGLTAKTALEAASWTVITN